MLGSFCKNAFVAHLFRRACQLIVVNKLRVPKNMRLKAKQIPKLVGMKLSLPLKLLARIQKRKRVIIGLRKKFNAAGIGEPLERLKSFGAIFFQLFKKEAPQRQP